MTAIEAKKLKPGDRVEWNDGARGTVREATYAGVKIEWDDGKWALMQFGYTTVPWACLAKLGSSIVGPATWPDDSERS